MTTTEPTVAPTLTAGLWEIDPSHSSVEFAARHLMVSKVRGHFTSFRGTITIADDQQASSVKASVDLDSVNTSDDKRDAHLRSGDFFNVEQHPTMDFRSTKVIGAGIAWTVSGELTVHGVSRPVTLDLEYNGVSPDPWGGVRAGFTATTELSRKDFGIEFNMPLDGGGVLIGDKIKVNLEIEAVRQA